MKRKNNLYSSLCELDSINDIYFDVVRKNTKNKKKLEKFEMFLGTNICSIKEKLEERKYKFGKYNIFLIRDPKYRIIMSEQISDKIVNHLVSKYVLYEILDTSLIDSNVATRKNKGTKYGNELVRKYLNYLNYKYESFYVLKLDISKYFYSIDHEILKSMLEEKCKDKDSLDLVNKILNNTNNNYINSVIDKLIQNELVKVNTKNISTIEKRKKIEELSKIKKYEKGKGLPIGSMTSQILAIFYLNKVDHYIKEKLKIKHYVRYMDDMILMHNDKEYLKQCKIKIEEILNRELKLDLNKKSNIFCIKHGFNFLGFRYRKTNGKIDIRLSSSTKKRMITNVKRYIKSSKDAYALVTNYQSLLYNSKCKYKIESLRYK